jgi:hypothetical protein
VAYADKGKTLLAVTDAGIVTTWRASK